MDTQALRLFILAAERANISRAGQSLGLAPAVSSARLAKLEAQLRVELLHRSTRRVALSPDGEAFLPYAREIVAQEDAGFAALGYGQAEVTGQLRFAAPSTLAQLHLVPLLPTFQSRYPKIELDLKLSDIQLDVIEGSFDLALRNAKPEDTSLKGRKLTSDTRVLCAAPSYLAAHGAPQDVADLREHAFIAFQSVAIRNFVSTTGERLGFDPRDAARRMIIDDGASQREATLAGFGISVNSLWSVGRDLEAGRLVRVLPDVVLDDQAALWLVYPSSHVLTAKVRAMIDFLVAEMAPKLEEALRLA